ncbi:B-cell receptor-associated protein 29 [Liparis tanakae]|uniref:Endoplasmic reticulum transmembrane protein n=1 Tax=Liparis tanakae TaxID=230148 RepID=A0A4Z2EXF6_9TELE|nr:B-cell receptor-associated protein 29 [Liparis tanakae]
MTLQWTVVALFLYVEMGILVILCLPFISARRSNAVREVRKYSAKELGTDAKLQPNMYDHLHMKLFRAQRNLYISGFAVFLWLVMKRVVTLINQLASASGATAALQAQADNATRTATKYKEDNELLEQVDATPHATRRTGRTQSLSPCSL